MEITATALIRDVLSLKADALLLSGATPDYVISNLMKLTKADKTETFKLKGILPKRLPKGSRKIAETDQETLIERDYKDNSIRLSALTQLKNIIGLDAPTKQEIGGMGGKSFSEELTDVLRQIDGKSRGILPCDQEDE